MAHLLERLRSALSDPKASEEKVRQKSTYDNGGSVIHSNDVLSPLLSNTIIPHSTELENAEVISETAYESVWKEIFEEKDNLIIGQQEYGRQHKQRFRELLNALVLLTRNKEMPKIIDFGISEFSAFYKRFKPGILLHTADRPTDENYIGFTKKVCENVSGCAQHFEIDLNRPKSIRPLFAEHQRSYDLILFTEILEHLIVNPIELLKELLNLLNDNGSLYLTTPNFYSKRNLDLIALRENPQAVYPEADGNWDAHHHFREYCAKELLAMIEKAGGETTRFYYSNCWDNEKGSNYPVEQRENLVFVIERGTEAL